MAKIDIEKLTKHLSDSAKSIKQGDIDEIIGRGEELFKIVKSTKVLSKMWLGIGSLFGLVKDYSSRSYRNVAIWDIAIAVAALIYVLSPLDLLPDLMPIVGYIDDAAIITWSLSKLKDTIEEYSDWKVSETNIN